MRAGLGGFVCTACGAALVTRVLRTITGKRRKYVADCAKCLGKRCTYVGLIRHDLRRSGAKALRLAGVPESLVMATGGWETFSVFKRYAIESETDQLMVVAAIEKAQAERGTAAGSEVRSLKLQ
ncbi:MAG TPA: hypothetical protein VN946_02350 [Terriglobales bacterium]|nr:hypothetical protein [Terriglobales bacterium]